MALNFFHYTPSVDKYGPVGAPEPAPEKPQQGRIADMADSATAGFYNATGGILDMVGAKGFAKNFYGWADENIQEMSDRGQQAISKNIIQKDELGDWSLGEGATDFDTWLLGFANMAGQFAPTMIPGAGAASLATKAGLGALGVNAARIGGYAAAGGSAATGQAMEEARQEVAAMPDGVLMQSDRFKRLIGEVDKEQPGLDDDSLWDAAKARLADQVAADVQTDPKVLIANYAASAIGDPIIGRALAGARIAKGALGSAAKGFAVEGTTEAAQAGVTKYGVNEALQPIDGRDAMQGVDVAAANEGIMGGLFGGVIGGTGGVWNRGASPEADQQMPADSGSVIAANGQPVQPDPSINLPPQVEQALAPEPSIQDIISQVKDPDAIQLESTNPVLAEAMHNSAKSAAVRQLDLDSIISDLKETPVAKPTIPQNENIPSPATVETDGASQSQGVPADEGRVEPRLTGFDWPAPVASELVQFVPENMVADNNASEPDNSLTQPEVAQERPVRVKGNGLPFQSPKEALASKSARVAKKAGQTLEAVPFGEGFGWRVAAPQPTVQVDETIQAGSFTNDGTNVSDLAAVTANPEVDKTKQAQPEIEVTSGELSEGHDSSQPTSSEPTPTRLGDGAEVLTTLAEPAPTVQEVSDVPQMVSTGFAVESDANSVKVYGDPASIRQTLRSQGINFDGAEIEGGLSFGKKLENRIRPVFENAEIPTGAATELPAILQTTKKKYIAQQVKQQKLKEMSPGYAQAVARLEEQYESDVDRAQASLTFEQFNALNDDSPESVNRQAYKALREEFGLPTDLKFSRVSAVANVVEVDTTALPATENLKELSLAALDYAARNFAGSTVKNAKTGHQITISKNGVKHTLRGAQPDLIKSVVATPDLLTQADYLGAQPHKSGNPSIVATHYYGVKANIGGVVHDIVAVVHEQSDGKRYYDHSIERKQTGAAQTENSNVSLATPESTPSNDVDGISIADNSTTEQPPLPDSKNPDLVRLIGSQLPLSGSPDRGSEQNVLTKEDLVKENPDIQFNRENTIESKPAKGVNPKLAEQLVASIMKRLNGAAGIKVVILKTQAEAESLWQMSLEGDLVRGAFDAGSNTAYIIAENIRSTEELRTTLAHEVIGHGGLKNVVSAEVYGDFIRRLQTTRTNKYFSGLWRQIDRDYDGLSESDKAEELFAYYVQNKPVEGPVKYWWNALKRWLHKVLVSVGLAQAGDPDLDLMDDMLESIRAGFMFKRNAAKAGSDNTEPTELAFSKTSTAETISGAINDMVGRKRLDPSDPFAEENRRLREQDKTLWEKAKQVFMRNFAPGGMLPRSIFDAKITRDGEIESGEMTIKHLIFALERAVQKDSGKNVDNQSDEFINMMADALAGKVNDKLGNETKAALVAMRQYIDALSGDYLSVIQTKIDELTERIKQDDKYTDKVQALNEIELYEKIKGNMGVYVNRSYRAFDDPKWFQKVPVDVINRAREYLRGQYKAQGDDQAEANRKAEVTLNKILKTDTAYDSMASFIAESKLGAKDLSTLIARKDISPEIRELLGEYKDPRMNFAKTATKMARLVWNSRFLDKVKADGVGVFFFDEESRPAEATVQIAGDQSKTYEPLNGYWTFPEVAEALQDSLGAEKMEAWYEAAVKLTSIVKYGKTVLSPTTAMRNWQSAMFFAVANGHFDFKHMKKSMAAFREQVTQNAKGDDLAYLKKLKKLGVVYDAPYAGEMMQLLSDSKIDEWLEGRKGKVFGTARQINNLAQGFYSFGDDFWKIIGYENEKANFISAGLSETEAEKMAAERIRNTYPTYSMVGRAIKKLARFPLMGTFVSFPAEIIRTTANMLRYAAQDMKSDNPKIRAMARKRLTGMALVSGMFYALSAMTAAMLGVDDEEEEAIRDVGPSWQKNSTFLFYDRDDKGKLQYFDISFLDPYGYFKRPITALLRDQPWEDAAASGAADMLSPFFGADITAGTFFQVFANKKQSGGQVYNEYADGTDQLVSIADHIWTGLRPGFVNNAMGIFNAAVGNRREGSGKEYDLGDEMMALMGWRASSLDAPTALYYRSFDFADQLQAANSTLNKVLRSDNSVDDDDIADAKEEAQRQYDDAFKQMQRIVQSGRNAGMTKAQVYRTLKLSGVSSRNISGLVNGNIPPMQAATLQTQAKAVAKAREIRGDEQASEVLRRFQIARQLQ